MIEAVKKFTQPQRGDIRDYALKLSLCIGGAILFFAFSLLTSSLLVLMFYFPLTAFLIPFAFFATFIFAVFCAKMLFKNRGFLPFLIICIAVLLLFFSLLFLSGSVYDVSGDGQFYHQEAVIQIAHGWNPVYEVLSYPKEASEFINPYTKAPWINAAALYRATGWIEQGKVFNFLLIFASFFLSLAAFLSLRRIKGYMVPILSFLAAFNPISICQVFTYYVDGQLASLIICFAAAACLMFTRRNRLVEFAFFMIVVLAINVKLTAVGYLFFFIAGVSLLLFFKKDRKHCMDFVSLSLLAFLVGIFVYGYNPFITNTLKAGNPFYIIAGPQKVDLMRDQRPIGFENKNRFVRLFFSLFSQADNLKRPILKWPGSFYLREIGNFGCPDLRISGFGPFFSAILILSLLIIVTSLALKLPRAGWALGLAALIVFSVLMNPEAWWARYVPQLWLVPFVCLIFSFSVSNNLLRFIGGFLFFFMFINVLCVTSGSLLGALQDNVTLKKQLSVVAGWHEPVFVRFGPFFSNRIRLQEYGIRYLEVQKMPCPWPLELLGYGGWMTEVCPSSCLDEMSGARLKLVIEF